VFVFGVAVALAYRRVPNVGWVDTVLAACACWIGVGMLQEIRNSWLFWRVNRRLPSEVQWGFALELTRKFAALVMIAAAEAFVVIRQTRNDAQDGDFVFDWALANLAWTILFFGIILSYWPKRRAQKADRERRVARWAAMFDLLVIALGAYWLLLILASQMAAVGVVHIAIRSLESYQPLRWMNEPFYPANFHAELTHQFVARSIVAAVLITAAFGCTFLLNRFWNANRMRIMWIVVWIINASGAALLAWWAWAVAYPVLSPFLAPQTFIQPSINWIAGLTLIIGASLALACRLVPRPIDGNDATSFAPRQETLHFSMPVMILFLITTIGISMQYSSISSVFRSLLGFSSPPFIERVMEYSSGLLEMWVSDPRLIMQSAAILVVARHVWRKWRRMEPDRDVPLTVNPIQLLSVAALFAVNLVVAVPVAAWLGFVLVVYAPLLGL